MSEMKALFFLHKKKVVVGAQEKENSSRDAGIEKQTLHSEEKEEGRRKSKI